MTAGTRVGNLWEALMALFPFGRKAAATATGSEALTAFLARHGHGVVVPDRSRLQLPEKQGY